jgi:hypothetical protein
MKAHVIDKIKAIFGTSSVTSSGFLGRQCMKTASPAAFAIIASFTCTSKEGSNSSKAD